LTYVRADAPGDWLLDVGGDAAFPRQAWVNGVKVLTAAGSSADGAANVRLNQGLNSVFLRIVQPEGKRLETHAVFLRSKGVKDNVDARVPLLRWFREPPGLVLDISPDRANRVGWYRFLAPPGVSSMRLGLRARNVQAWVDGIHAAVHDGTISFATPAKETTQIALRVEHEAGCYAGAAFINPVRFDCVEGLIPLGDWSRHGLAMYSGAAVYTQTVHLDKRHLDAHVLLDLGNVRVVAEVAVNGSPAGIRMTEPFTLDITSLVREGDNEIRIRVVNTLANHMSSYPTRFVYEGQTVSGLLGPVQIRFLRRTALVAGRVRP